MLPIITAFPDLRYVSHEVVSDGISTVVNRWTFSGTFKSDFEGYKATGARVSWSGLTLNRFNVDGKLSELVTVFDRKPFYDALAREVKKMITITKRK